MQKPINIVMSVRLLCSSELLSLTILPSGEQCWLGFFARVGFSGGLGFTLVMTNPELGVDGGLT